MINIDDYKDLVLSKCVHSKDCTVSFGDADTDKNGYPYWNYDIAPGVEFYIQKTNDNPESLCKIFIMLTDSYRTIGNIILKCKYVEDEVFITDEPNFFDESTYRFIDTVMVFDKMGFIDLQIKGYYNNLIKIEDFNLDGYFHIDTEFFIIDKIIN